MVRHLLYLSFLLFTAIAANAQPPTKFSAPVASLTAYVEGDRYGAPVISLGDEVLTVSFDLLEPERRYLRYSLTHCDRNWEPDCLQAIEFTNGFNEASIDDFGYSQATLIPYVNYRFSLPNNNLSPTVSGNYLISIYEEGQSDHPLAVLPFMVSEQVARIEASVTGRSDFDYNGAHQQLEIIVDNGAADIHDPWTDLTVAITPNFRGDLRHTLSRPINVSGSRMTYAHDQALNFEAGKEFRRFETVETSRYLPMGIEYVTYRDPWYHFQLYESKPRKDTDYEYDQTQFGRFTVNADDVGDPDTEADYVKAHFSLDIPEQPNAHVMIIGELTGNRTDLSSPGMMNFNRTSSRYEGELTLKQGSYNFQYVIITPEGVATTTPIDGNDYRTANRYDIVLYYRAPGQRYDRLLGHTNIYSGI